MNSPKKSFAGVTFGMAFPWLIALSLLAWSLLSELRHRGASSDRNSRISELTLEVESLNAEMEGVREANAALHILLARLRAEPASMAAAALPLPPAQKAAASESAPTEEFFPMEDVEEGPIPPPESWAAQPDQISPPVLSLPSARPTPSPQLIEMMKMYPEIDPETVLNQPNMIEEYLKVNPHIREELNRPSGKYGAGIEAVMQQYPDLAEKVRKAEALAEGIE